MSRHEAGTERRRPVHLLLGGAIIVMVAFWTLLIIDDHAVGFGRSWRLLPSGLFIVLAITHVVTAPIAWIVSVVGRVRGTQFIPASV